MNIIFSLIALLLILCKPTSTNTDMPELKSLFNSLRYQNQKVYDSSPERSKTEINEGIRFGIFREADESYFNQCGQSCLIKLKELFIPLSKKGVGLKYKVEVLYEDFELTKPIAELIATQPFLIRIGNELYPVEEKPANYLLVFPKDKNDRYASLLPTSIPFIEPYREGDYKFKAGGAIWLKWIKKFAYYYKYSSFFLASLKENNSTHENICQNNVFSGFRGNPKLYDDNNKLVPAELIKKLIVLGYKIENDYIRFYFASDKKISNLVDGVMIKPNYLVSYYKLHKEQSYSLKKSDLIDENGEIVYFQGFDYSGSFALNCPVEIPSLYEVKLRNKEINFSELPKDFRT